MAWNLNKMIGFKGKVSIPLAVSFYILVRECYSLLPIYKRVLQIIIVSRKKRKN